MHDSITMAEVGSIVKVSGSRIATPFGPPRPGSTPTKMPSDQPEHHQRQRLPGQQDAEAVAAGAECFHRPRSRSSASSGPFGMITSKAISKVTNMTSGEDERGEHRLPRRDAADQDHEARDEEEARDVNPEPLREQARRASVGTKTCITRLSCVAPTKGSLGVAPRGAAP